LGCVSCTWNGSWNPFPSFTGSAGSKGLKCNGSGYVSPANSDGNCVTYAIYLTNILAINGACNETLGEGQNWCNRLANGAPQGCASENVQYTGAGADYQVCGKCGNPRSICPYPCDPPDKNGHCYS
jgi:hypothetical protein